MSNLAELEKQVLRLPSAERGQLALIAGESLEVGDIASDALMDPEGIDMAARRDSEIESGTVAAVDHDEFLVRTGDVAE